MMKTVAAVIAVILALIVFHAQIKAAILDLRMSIVISRMEVDDLKKEELSKLMSRVAEGYRLKKFSEVEVQTLQELMAEMRRKPGMPAEDLRLLEGKFNALLKRYDL